MEPRHGVPLLLLSWLLIGQPWADVGAWEELTLRRKPFSTQLACEHHLTRQRAKARGRPTRRWDEARCVTEEDFEHYPKSFTFDDYSLTN